MAGRNLTLVEPDEPSGVYFSSKELSVFAKVLSDAIAEREGAITLSATNGRELLHIVAAAIIRSAEDGESDRRSLMNAARGAANAGDPMGMVGAAIANSTGPVESMAAAPAEGRSR